MDECGVCGGTGTSCALGIEMSVQVTQLKEAQTDVSDTEAPLARWSIWEALLYIYCKSSWQCSEVTISAGHHCQRAGGIYCNEAGSSAEFGLTDDIKPEHSFRATEQLPIGGTCEALK